MTMIKAVLSAARLLAIFTVLLGVLYPLAVTGIAQTLFSAQANGSLVQADNATVGSDLIGQDWNGQTNYFWGRPSAINYAPLPSSGSNQAVVSASLVEAVAQRAAQLRQAHNVAADAPVPPDLLYASGSGLDPHISPDAARWQIARVAAARGLTAEAVTQLVERTIEGPQWGVFGQARVNVLRLNLALDQLQP
jgi:potassium-transporting ATPase KdpC subunit